MLYARPHPDEPGQTDVRDFDEAPPAAKGWRPLVIDPRPSATALQVVAAGPVTYSDAEARQTWAIRAKTADEIAREDDAAEREQLKAGAILDLLKAEAAGTSTLTAAQSRKLFARCLLWLVNRQ